MRDGVLGGALGKDCLNAAALVVVRGLDDALLDRRILQWFDKLVWDGDSRGTFANIRTLVAAEKPVVVYLSADRSFVTVKNQTDIDALLSRRALPAQA